ncbi:MAG: hypothetical protein IPJ58_00945 [Ardenticatenia bacterium]|nr:hypothetical protein [Ardenticatenia bacterium]
MDLQIPGVPTLCFSSMEVWVDDEQADDDTLLVQHVDDLNDPTCFNGEPDAYSLVSTPRWTIGRSQFINHPNSPQPKECVEAQEGISPGGQSYEVCIFANFAPN